MLLNYDIIPEIIKYSDIETKIKLNKIFHLKPGKLKIQFEFKFVPKCIMVRSKFTYINSYEVVLGTCSGPFVYCLRYVEHTDCSVRQFTATETKYSENYATSYLIFELIENEWKQC
jgi:hypothetical protein